jgi:hypothetical protein
MGFGSSYSCVHVDCLDWVHTDWVRKLVRGIIGLIIAIVVFLLFQLIPGNDNPTIFFFHNAFPALVISFFIFGIFPIICNKVGLVKPVTAPTIISDDPLKDNDKRKKLNDAKKEDPADEDKASLVEKAAKNLKNK